MTLTASRPLTEAPGTFAEVFIRHFDRKHRYYSGTYACHQEQYKETGLTKADIKGEFERIVDLLKDQISRWAKDEQRQERYTLYLKLKEEFEGGKKDEHRV
jgi:5-bromo-4-chloroindolyl phosphate hydrolysis protein